MIISFNPTVFKTQDSNIQSILAEILVKLLDDNHFLDARNIESIFFDDTGKYIFNENNVYKVHLSTNQRQKLKDYISKKISEPITQIHRSYLTHFIIGIDFGEIKPVDAYKIITERSKIIVENGINDWKFISGICQKYSSGTLKRKSIYLLIDKSIKKGIIEADHAGGIGEIPKVIERWIADPRYCNIHKYKLMTIFDSDKTHAGDFIKRYKNLIEFLKKGLISNPPKENDINYEETDLIMWHMLHKRKIENYIHLDILFTNISINLTQEVNLRNTNETNLDYIEYNESNIGQVNIKKKFPEMFLDNFYYKKLEERCQHHKTFLSEANEVVSEIEQILLKIAKII